MKKAFKSISLIFLILSMSFTSLAHPGRTDANGGHYDKKTGEYHYHNSQSSSDNLSEKNESDIIVSLQIDNPWMRVKGVSTEIDSGRGTNPVVLNGRTLVPIRAIIEAFGGYVGWEESSQTVILVLEDDTIKLGIDRTVAYLNDTAQILDVAPTVINERTMLPIRFVAEGFNLGVAWENDTQTVSIIRNSFDIITYEPEHSNAWEEAYQRFLNICK